MRKRERGRERGGAERREGEGEGGRGVMGGEGIRDGGGE